MLNQFFQRKKWPRSETQIYIKKGRALIREGINSEDEKDPVRKKASKMVQIYVALQ